MTIINLRDVTKYRNATGIYMFRNRINGKCYVGQSLKIGKRIREHLCAIHDKNRQYSIHRAILKYGIENFDIIILTVFEKCDAIRKALNTAEQIYICFYNSFKNGYNETAGGDSTTGRKWTEQQRETMRKKLTGYKRPAYYIDPRSKFIYAYNTKTGEYIEAPSAKHMSYILADSTMNNIQACASGKNDTTKGVICAYSKEELARRIQNFKLTNGSKIKKNRRQSNISDSRN